MQRNAIDLQSTAPYRLHIHIYRHCNHRLKQRADLFTKMKQFAEAQRDSLATSYLREYVQGDSFLDFGNDDPSFFAAENGQSRLSCRVTQGICRKDLRRRAKLHDLTVFVCARETDDCNNWDYFLVGFGELIEKWAQTDPRIARYLNRMLVKTDVKHIFKHAERMDRHIDWIHRVSDLRKAHLNSVLAATAMRLEHVDTRGNSSRFSLSGL
jgi:hypothetical protein